VWELGLSGGFGGEELGFVFYDGECVKMDRVKLGFLC